MADLFDRGMYMNDAALNFTENNGSRNSGEADLVLVCFQISVWSGMQTEQTSIEEGAEYMKRRRIIPAMMLKPFLDFRARARALCQEMGEPYLNGFVMRRHDALIAERALSVWREEFCRKRDEVFAPKYQEILAQRVKGIVPPGCSREAVFPRTEFVLRRITFEFDAFALAGSGKGGKSSKEAFLKGLTTRFVDELDLIDASVETNTVRDATLCRLRALKERLDSWQTIEPRFENASCALEASIRQGSRTEVWARDRTAFKEGLAKAKQVVLEVLAHPPQCAEEPAVEVSVTKAEAPKAPGSQFTGAAGMIARGRSLFSF